MLSSPADRKKLLDAMKEMSYSMTRVDSEKDFQKDVIVRLNDELGLDKKHLRRLANIYHKNNYNDVQQAHDELADLYAMIATVDPTE